MNIIAHLRKQEQASENSRKGIYRVMKSKVINCYDYRQLTVSKEQGKWRYPDSVIRNELEALAKDHSGEETVEEVEKGDSVRCICTQSSFALREGQSILLFPGRRLPGAEKAEEVVVGKKCGEEFSSSIKDEKVTFRIEKILRKHVMTISDELVGLLEIPGVQTVENYYHWYHEQHDREEKEKTCIRISQYWLEAIAKKSDIQIDEEEKSAWCMNRAKLKYNALVIAGIDPKKQRDGSVVDEKEALDIYASEEEMYFVPYIIYCYFCEKDNYILTEEGMKEEVAVMAEKQGVKMEELMKQADFESFRMVRYQEHTFHKLMKEAEKYLEV